MPPRTARASPPAWLSGGSSFIAPRTYSGSAHPVVGTAGNEIGHRLADTVIQAGGDEMELRVIFGHQVEQTALGPVVHDVMAAEQRDIVGIGDLTQDAFISLEVDHCMSSA